MTAMRSIPRSSWRVAVLATSVFLAACSGTSSAYISNARLSEDGSLCVSHGDEAYASAGPIVLSPPAQDSVDGSLVIAPDGAAQFRLGTERDPGRTIDLVVSATPCER